MLSFATLNEVGGFVREVRGSQLIPSSIEIINDIAIQSLKLPVPLNTHYLVAIGLEGICESVERQISEMSEIGKKYGTLQTGTLDTEKHQSFWIAIRDFSQGLIGSNPNFISLKSNFLISKCKEILEGYEKNIGDFGMEGAFICHAGSGILYSYLLVGKHFQSKIKQLVELIENLTAEAVTNGGNLIVESSPLAIKKKINVWGQPRSDYLIMRRLKEQIDPANILNRGRFVGGI